MNFEKVLGAMSEGKKVTGSCVKGGYLELFLRIHRDRSFEEEHVLRYTTEDSVTELPCIPVDWLLADNWEIVPEPTCAIVKTKTIEYVACPNCGKELELTKLHKYSRCCGFCGTQIQLLRKQKRGSLL
ncbi:MAG: hypothetical protein WCS17_04975 [Prevotella sp.]